jgi:hypothetical protein
VGNEGNVRNAPTAAVLSWGMAYAVAIVVFLVALVATMFIFGELVPMAYVEWSRRNSWGREVTGILMVACTLVVALIAFWLVR